MGSHECPSLGILKNDEQSSFIVYSLIPMSIQQPTAK